MWPLSDFRILAALLLTLLAMSIGTYRALADREKSKHDQLGFVVVATGIGMGIFAISMAAVLAATAAWNWIAK